MKRFAALDAFRGFAALWVVLFHGYGDWIAKGIIHLPAGVSVFVMHGWLGVQVFFVVSGYCIAERLAACAKTGESGLHFVADRLWRLLPPYWAAVAFTIVVSVSALPFNRGVLFSTGSLGGALPSGSAAWLRMLTLQEVWYGPPYLLVSWTLSYEIAFYLVALLWFQLSLRTSWRLGFLGSTVMAAAALHPAYRTWVPFGSAWPSFYAGTSLWLLINRSRTANASDTTRAATAMLGLALICCCEIDAVEGFAIICCAVAMLISARLGSAFTDSPPIRTLGWFGGFAYSIYLVHAPIVGKVRNLAGRIHAPAEWIWPLAASVIAIVIARYFFSRIKQPSERARKSIMRLWFPGRRLGTA